MEPINRPRGKIGNITLASTIVGSIVGGVEGGIVGFIIGSLIENSDKIKRG